ncbi:haloacid dehalogenase [Agrocybe pediades]|nr:haloacid dehalogenase [Agrocybe pediades]
MDEVEALVFDVFGTVVDWRSSVAAELQALGKEHGVSSDTDWVKFVNQWRMGYITNTSVVPLVGSFGGIFFSNLSRRIAEGGSGPLNVDVLHKETLEGMLDSPEWSHVGRAWDAQVRESINLAWHRLNGWPDTVEGLQALKRLKIISTLSNGNVRLLVDMAKHAKLPWDMIFSTELFGTFKPSPKAYLSACHHLSLPPAKCAMVAAHIYDLRAAAAQGMRTIYVRRPNEDEEALSTMGGIVKSKADGGEFDIVVDSFIELAEILGKSK